MSRPPIGRPPSRKEGGGKKHGYTPRLFSRLQDSDSGRAAGLHTFSYLPQQKTEQSKEVPFLE
ncbi:hypothetical protein V494_08192, partial [Pseudogymnoascus sp. VKM F-4513 (FW-928)]